MDTYEYIIHSSYVFGSVLYGSFPQKKQKKTKKPNTFIDGDF